MKRPGMFWIATPFMAIFGFVMCIALLGGGGASTGYVACEGSSPSASGQPALVAYYINAADRYHLGADGYAYLAAINERETDFGTDVATSSTGASGWMAFEPATFAEYGVSVTDPSAPADPMDPQDAIFSTANYLHASGAPKSWSTAIFAYNHADWYVQQVEDLAQGYEGSTGLAKLQADIKAAWGTSTQPNWPVPVGGARTSPTSTAPSNAPKGSTTSFVDATTSTSATSTSTTSTTSTTAANGCPTQLQGGTPAAAQVQPVPGKSAVIMSDGLARPGSDAPQDVQSMIGGGDRLVGEAYSYGGAHCVAAMNQTTPDPDACPGNEENGDPGFDCSSTVSYVLWAGGLQSLIGNTPEASGALAQEGDAGSGTWVTWYANAGHTFILVDGIVLDTVHGPTTVSPSGSPATGPRWASSSEVSFEFKWDGYFAARHPGTL